MATTSRKTESEKGSGQRVSVRVSEALARRIEKVAIRNGISSSDVVRMALNSQLDAVMAANKKAA